MKNIVASIIRKVGQNRGQPRLWLEGILPERAGFAPGARYEIIVSPHRLILRCEQAGRRVVSVKERAGRRMPVIDINSAELLSSFKEVERVRVILLRGEIHVLPDAVAVRQAERRRRLATELAAGEVSIGSVSHGAGILSNALHRGLSDAGLTPRLKWACDIREECIEQAALANDCWSEDTIAVAMPLQQVAFADEYLRSRLPKPSILEGGLPCTAASTAGRAKKGLRLPEEDPGVGHLIAGFIALVAWMNPAVVLLENVVPYWSTASAAILRTQLAELGYTVQEKELRGEDYAIEARQRRVLVATTEGVELDLAAMLPPPREVKTVGEILEPVAEDDPRWSPMTYLREKEARDRAAGKGFAMAVVSPEDTRVGTLGTGYNRNRSTEPKVRHPRTPDLLRLFTPREHARLKGIPEHLIAGVESRTLAHELLGQSVIWPAFRHLGRYIGQALRQWCAPAAQPEAVPAFALSA